jgi:zinc/manganese transport system substrate-binding protein
VTARLSVAAAAAGIGLALGPVLAACGSNGAPSAGSGLGNGLSAPAHGAASAAGKGRLAVVAGENTWGDILRQIGGRDVSVTSVIDDPNTDPHEYESTVGDAAAVEHAKLVVRNGAGYDDFLARLLGASHPAGRVELDVADIVGVHGSNPNPHLWYDPGYTQAAARAFEAELATLDPAHASDFRANLQNFLAGEQQVVSLVDEIAAKYRGTPVGYTERVGGYLLDACGLRLATPAGFAQAVEDGNDPSPLDNAIFEDAITKRRIRVLVYNAQVSDQLTAHLKKLATSSHIPIVGMSEMLPSSERDYQSWQADQARALLEALGG